MSRNILEEEGGIGVWPCRRKITLHQLPMYAYLEHLDMDLGSLRAEAAEK
jgi:hypothetical protein